MWLAFLAGWINRVELRSRAEADVAALGFSFEREGFRWRVFASGQLGTTPVRVRWSTGALGPRTSCRVGQGEWEELAEGEALPAWLQARLVPS